MGTRTTITCNDDFQLGAYLAEPNGKARGGIAICQEIFGINSYIESVCEFYSQAGYATVAPALFDRAEPNLDIKYSPEGVKRGIEISTRVDWDQALDDLEASLNTLRARGIEKFGIVGFCWGGTLAWLSACRREVDCAVAYYGAEIEHFPNEHSRRPVIMHIGEEDPVIPADKLAAIKKAQAGTPIYTYPKASHGFDNENRPNYDPATVMLARERTLDFLAQHVG